MSNISEKMTLSELGQHIRLLRERAGISATSLAAKAGLTQSHLSKLETGAALPSLKALEKICNAMGISLGEFFAEKQPCLPVHIERLLQELRFLTPEQAEYLCKFVAAMRRQ